MSDENRISERKRIEEPKDCMEEMSDKKQTSEEKHQIAKGIAYSGKYQLINVTVRKVGRESLIKSSSSYHLLLMQYEVFITLSPAKGDSCLRGGLSVYFTD